jgi:2-polyprenyl-6-methoxyphenol hydroxylase-like FAD-dependent oxidoreductase
VRALEALGFGDYARSHALTVAAGGLRDWRGRPLLVADLGSAQGVTGTVAMAGRTDLHQALREPLPDEVILTGTPVERLEQDQAGVWVVSAGQRVHALTRRWWPTASAADCARSCSPIIQGCGGLVA